jgi:hypothetical protein
MSDFQSSDLGLLSRECITLHLYGSQIELILAGLALLQQKTQEGEQQPFSPTQIDSLRGEINEGITAHLRSPEFLWKQQVAQMSQEVDSITPLNQLISHLDYAVGKDNLSPEQALEVLAGERSYLLDIDRQKLREEALAAFDEVAKLKESVAYVTRDFVRNDCGIHGTTFSDEDCDLVIAKVQRLAMEDKFQHTGVYWIANALAADRLIHPIQSDT